MSERTQSILLKLCDRQTHQINTEQISAPCLSYKPSRKALASVKAEKAKGIEVFIPEHVCMPIWTLPVKEADRGVPGGAFTVVTDSFRGMSDMSDFCNYRTHPICPTIV